MIKAILAHKVIAALVAVVLVGGAAGGVVAVNSNSGSGASIVAVLGDSYSVGEGTGGPNGQSGPAAPNYIPPTDNGNFGGPNKPGTESANPRNLPFGDACHRSKLSYAVTILHVTPQYFVACSGASSGDMDGLTGVSASDQPNNTSSRDDGNLSQVNRLRLPPTTKDALGAPNPNIKTVVISVGGDDMGFAGVLGACSSKIAVAPFFGSGAAPGACQTAIDQDEAGTNPLPNGNTGYSGGFAALQGHLYCPPNTAFDSKNHPHVACSPSKKSTPANGLYADIHAAAPDAHIYTVGYPHIFPPDGHSGCNGIRPQDQIALNNATSALNDTINTAASQAGVTFVDTTNVMNNHWICGNNFGSDGWINDLQLTSTGTLPAPDGSGIQVHPGPHNCKYKNVAQWEATYPVFGMIGVCSQSYHPTAKGSSAIGQKVEDCITNAASCEPNPSPDAIAAWKATFGGCAATMAASLQGVADLLPMSDTTQIAELKQFGGLPLAELGEGSQQQQAEGQADLTALNKFFGTNRALTTFTGSCSATPTPPTGNTPPDDNGSPADAVEGFYQNELAGDWLAVPNPLGGSDILTGVCSYVVPDAKALCDAGTAGQGPATGQVTVGQAVTMGNEALVPVTGNICAPNSPCVENDDPTTGMPLGPPVSPSDFAAAYQTAVANTTGSTTVLSPIPCSEVNGLWYVNFAGLGGSGNPDTGTSTPPPPQTPQPGPDPSPAPGGGAAATTTPPTTHTTPPTTPQPGPDPSPVSTPTPPANALAAWNALANDDSAELSAAFTGVANDLPSSDATQIAELNQLANLPQTGDTSAQMAEAQADVTALDKFFNTPGFQPNL